MVVNQAFLIDAVGLKVAGNLSDVAQYSTPIDIPGLMLPPVLDYVLEEEMPRCCESDISKQCPPWPEIHTIIWISWEVDPVRSASFYVNGLEAISLEV